MGVKRLQVFTDSLLVSNQISDNYIAKEMGVQKLQVLTDSLKLRQ